ncbi:MAG: hypothetical protein FJ263_03640 [Planctomycetes bacterium]|nr:hypothetical protein [Planctomycetota bacterium]
MPTKVIILCLLCITAGSPFAGADESFPHSSESAQIRSSFSIFTELWTRGGRSSTQGDDKNLSQNLQNKTYASQTVKPILAKISLIDWVIAIIGISILVFLCVAFLFGGKSGLPSLHESFIQAGILLLLILLICGVNVTCFYWIYSNASRHGQLPGAIFYIMPLAFLLVVILAYRPTYALITKYHLHCLRRGSKEPQQSICELVKSIAHSMEIKARISPISSNISDISPYVIGTSKECYIVLPSNYDSLLEGACGDNGLKEGLGRLILSHELAHIKNGDIYLLPIYWVITKPLKWFCLASIVLYFCIKYCINPSSTVMLFAGNLIPLNITVFCFLYISIRYLLKKREQLADAVATLFTHPDTVQQLTLESGTMLAPLEMFIFSLITRSPLNRFCFGYALKEQSIIWGFALFKKKIADFRLSYVNRARAVVSKENALNGVYLTVKEILFIAAVTAITFAVIRFVKSGLIVNHLIAFGLPEDIGEGELFTAGETLYRQYKWTGINLFCNIVLSFIAATFLIMHHRNSPGNHSKLKSITSYIPALLSELKTTPIWIIRIPAMLLTRIFKFFDKGTVIFYAVIYLLFFNIFISWIPSFSWKPLMLNFSWMQLRPPGIILLLTVMAVTYLLTHLKFERHYFPHTTIRLALPFSIDIDIAAFKILVQLLCLVLITVLFVKSDTYLPVLSKIAMVMFANMATVFALDTSTVQLISKHNYIRQECLIYRRIFLKKQYYSLPVIRDNTVSSRLTKEILIHLFITWIIPFCLLYFLGYILLIKFDLWYFNNIASLKESLNEIISAVPHQSHHGIFKVLFLIFLCNHVGPDKIPPSLALSMSIAILISLAVIAMILIQFAFEDKTKQRLNNIKLMGNISRLLCGGELPASHDKKYFVEKILPKCSQKHPYIFDIEKVPLMASTCDAILFAKRNNLDSRLMPNMICWIKQCMSSNGGFAVRPGIQPDAYHTWAALSMLHEIGQLNTSLKSANNRWLKRQLCEFMDCDNEQITDRDWLFYAENMVLSASLTDEGERFTNEEMKWLSRTAYYRWKRNEQSPLCTRLFVTIIKNLGLFNDTYDDVLAEWLHDHERKLSSLSPRAQLADIVEYITIISFLYPQAYLQRESVVQAMDNILKLHNQANIS